MIGMVDFDLPEQMTALSLDLLREISKELSDFIMSLNMTGIAIHLLIEVMPNSRSYISMSSSSMLILNNTYPLDVGLNEAAKIKSGVKIRFDSNGFSLGVICAEI
jgi:hypothetical protein